MEQINLKKYLYDRLNYAYSINYYLLDTLNQFLQDGKMYYSREDIFGKKSTYEEYLNNLHSYIATARNNYFERVQKSFDDCGFADLFQKNGEELINIYNGTSGNNVKFEDVFSKNDVVDWNFFADVETLLDSSSNDLINQGKATLSYVFSEYINFYEQYKVWRSANELLGALSDDFNSYGAKSLTFGKSDNKDIISVDSDYLDSVVKVCSDFIKNNVKKYAKEISKLKKQKADINDILNDPEKYSKLESQLAFEKLIDYCELFSERLISANSTPKIKKPLNARLVEFFGTLNTEPKQTKVDSVYVHAFELADFLAISSMFPELLEFSQDVSKKCFGEIIFETDLNQTSQTQTEKQ